ncbi:MAG: hypothetical protein IJX74_07545 [Clostridia bacterium]|nr:hypothetical protein [Clostridia bacterium]
MIESKGKKILCTAEILFLVLATFSPHVPQVIEIGVTLALIVISIWLLAKQNNGDVPLDNTILIAMICFVLAMLCDVRNVFGGQPYSMVDFMYPCYFLCGYLVAKRHSKTQFYDTLEKIVFVAAILSLVGMSVYYINSSWIYSFPTYVQGGRTHRTLFFFNYLFEGTWMAVRNSGFAWEPGAFQILINLALQIAIQRQDGKRLFSRVCIYTLAVIFTRSTIGYVVLAINLFCLVRKHKKYLPIIATACVLGLVVIIPELQYQIQYKLFGSRAFGARFTPLINAIKYAWYMPLGLGSTGYDAVYESAYIGSYDCFTQILLRFGYPMLIYVMGRIVKIFRSDNKYIAIILIISFLSEPIWGNLLITAMYYLEDKKTLGVPDGEIVAV